MEQVTAHLLAEMKTLLKASHKEMISKICSFQEEMKATTKEIKASKEEIIAGDKCLPGTRENRN
jgi:alanyl-tRNA synthetase